MHKSTNLGEIMETTCIQCSSRFRLTKKHLKQAHGKVRCGECGCIFNALQGLKNYEGGLPPNYRAQPEADIAADKPGAATDSESTPPAQPRPALSLHEAMYGNERRSFFTLGPLGWFIGILILGAVGLAQAIYYQRYQLIENPRYQQQVINLCEVLPCAPTAFASTEQLRLLERNVFTHPVARDALMVTGSFTNQAPFVQKLPDMLISLFDVQGKLIANRLFTPAQYMLDDKSRGVIEPEAIVQFRLEVVDPGTDALTYEFEFF